jgi:hypothetical protein
MPESLEVLDRPRFQKQTLITLISQIAQIAQIDSLVVPFASSRLRGECRSITSKGLAAATP